MAKKLIWNGSEEVIVKYAQKDSHGNDIPTDVVQYTAQTLTLGQQIQARTNIGAGTLSSVKALSTTATTSLSTSSSEALSGSGTISLHKISKTGKYSDLVGTPNWWYYEGSLSRTLNASSSVQGTALTRINDTGTSSIYGTVVSGSAVSKVNVQVGDLIFTKYGEIGSVTSVPSRYSTVPGYVGYVTKWISGASWYCIEEGTRITMADGTERPIEEVKQGDLILGWDFENNRSIEAVALFANFTHRDDKTNFVVFSNGEYISGTDDHFIYSVDKGRDVSINELTEGEKCLGTNGEIIEIYAIHRGIFQMGQKNFYHLVSSNNTYFANGVMNAAHPINKFNWVSYGANQQIPEEVMEILEQDAEEFKTFEFLVKNDTFRRQSVNLMKEIKTRENEIAELKQYLLDTDYVAIKHSEGLVIDDDILEERQAARDRINLLQDQIENNYRPAYNNLVITYSPLGADTLLSNEERRTKYFKIANKRDNEALNIFKKYYGNIKETD